MNKALLVMVLLLAGALATCSRLDPSTTVATCKGFADKSEYINAGCCYHQLKVWDECSLNLLKGARASEILWDRTAGSFQDGTLAKQYYNPEYSATFDVGSETGVCLNKYGDAALISDVTKYYDWITAYGYKRPDGTVSTPEPPFDMGARVAQVEMKIHPPAATPVPTTVPTYVPTAVPTAVPTTAPSQPQGDNNWMYILGIVVIAAIAGYFLLGKKGPPSKPARRAAPVKAPSVNVARGGYLYRAAEKAKKEHRRK